MTAPLEPTPQTASSPGDPDTEHDPVAAFVRHHQTGLWRYLRLCGAGARAEEAAQEALLVGIRRGIGGHDRQTTAAFLRRTARNVWLRGMRDDRRRAQRHAEAAELLWRRHLAHDNGSRWLEALEGCLDNLPARSRQAIESTYRDGERRGQLAEALGIGEHGVRTLLQRIRKTLKTCIERRLRA